MLSKNDPTQTSAWNKFKAHYTEMKTVQIKTLFDVDPERFEKNVNSVQ